MNKTVPEFRNGKIHHVIHTKNYFDDVVADWDDEDRKLRRREQLKTWMLMASIMKQRHALLGQVEPCMKSADQKRKDEKRGQASLI